MAKQSLSGRTILCFESRLSSETADLIEKYGGRAVMAPSLQEVPLDEHSAVFTFAEALQSHDIDILICLTGVGTRMMIEIMSTRYALESVVASMARVLIVSRGPKPVAALRAFGLKPAVKVPEPNTWSEVLASIDESPLLQPLTDKRIAVQEYGKANEELVAGLRSRGAHVHQVPIYRWALPDDLAPLTAGINALISGDIDIAVFTSRTQIDHVMRLAAEMELTEELNTAFDRAFVASIGPVCTQGLREYGIEPDFEPQRPKLGVMMRELAEAIVIRPTGPG